MLQRSSLFNQIEETELESLLSCLSPAQLDFCKNEFVLHAGELHAGVGLVLAGCVHIIEEDFWGNRSLLSEIEPGGLFGETYACLPNEPIEVSVIATQRTKILMLQSANFLSTCPTACVFHARLIKNFMYVLAQKNLMLTRKIGHLSRRSTREKLISYLSAQAKAFGSSAFQIPFNRQQLADYLLVDRSAMSNELCKMRVSGILDFHKNEFILKN